MTINEAIERLDALKPNTYKTEEKIRWLSELDQRIKNLIIDTHEGGAAAFSGYDEQTDMETKLLVGAPHENIYILWMSMQIDFYNGETKRYNNDVIAFNDAFQIFSNEYHRTHLPHDAGDFRF